MAKKQVLEEEAVNTDSQEIIENPETGENHSKKDAGTFSGLKFAIPIILVFLLIYGYFFSQFQQIPGPMYGGDYYFHYGIAKHIFNGNMPWTCPQFPGEWAFYPWFLHLSVAAIGWLTGDLFKSFVLYFPLLVTALTGVVVYLLGRELFEDIKFGLLTTLAFLGTRVAIGYIPANFTGTLMAPLFLFTMLKAYKTSEMKWVITAGISFGLFALSHASALPVGGFFLFLLFIYMIFQGRMTAGFNSETAQWNFGFEKKGFSESVKKSLKVVLPIALIGFLIGLLYWGPILFIYHFKILNPWNEFTQPDYAIYGGQVAKDVLIGYLFNIDALPASPQVFIGSILALAGIVMILTGKKTKNNTFLAVAFFAGFIGYFHYFITTPLMNTNYAPIRFATFMIVPTLFLLSIYSIYSLYHRIKLESNRKLFLALAFIYFIIVSGVTFDNAFNDQWAQLGLKPQNPATNELMTWVDKNTDKNAVFMSHDELSFALNGFTGRKVLFERRTHANPYVDINRRIADFGVMFYGNDSTKTLELLKKYNISYVYWDANYMYFAANEPSMTTPEYKDYLTQYGVRYQAMNTYLDAAWGPMYRKYDVLALIPARNNQYAPWSEEFAKHIKLIEQVESQGQAAYRVYEIDYSTF